MNILFIAGPGRSGTTGLANYLNQHPEILICRERYHWIPSEITPYSFAPENIAEDHTGATNTPRDYHLRLLSQKDPSQLKVIGDKAPRYVTELNMLAENNPGSRFMLLYRPIEEVVESYEKRAQNPNDRWLGGRDGFSIGIEQWNRAMQRTREFVESDRGSQALIIDYHKFFEQDDELLDRISAFLEMDFDQDIRETWRAMSADYGERRRDKPEYSQHKQLLLSEKKDREVEAWLFSRMEVQLAEQKQHSPNSDQVRLDGAASDGWREVEKELSSLEAQAQKRKIQRLEQHIDTLEKQNRRQGRRLTEVENKQVEGYSNYRIDYRRAVSQTLGKVRRVASRLKARMR